MFLPHRIYCTIYFTSALIATVAVTASQSTCKCIPSDACWPDPSDWANLNNSLSGALIPAIPPASVCYPNEPNYSENACTHVRESWFDSTFHGSDPISIDYPVWTNDSCNPIFPNGTSVTGDATAGTRGCNANTYPVYVVNATGSIQVATALKWAGKRNIRVVVKATGHSYTGRSTGGSSLSIWTHNLRGLEYIPSFSPTSCHFSDPISAVRVAAGHTNGEIQHYLAAHSRVIVSGANPSVGIVGWLTGGGHGFLSSSYGMGSDNLLEATIVLPSGAVVVANPCQHANIFSAIRGGGGGTFGVVTEVVLKTYPSPSTTMHVFTLSSLPDTPAARFWEAMGYLHTQMQRLKEGGMQGYYYIAGPPLAPSLSLMWAFMLFEKRPGTVETLLSPIEAYLAKHTDLLAYTSNTTHFLTYSAATQRIENEPVATGGSAYGSRLLSPSSLSNASRVAAVLSTIGPSGTASHPNAPLQNPVLIGHMIASPDPPLYHPSTSSLNPAWRNTLVHLVVAAGWQDGAPQSAVEEVRNNITAKTGVLRRLSPETGAYFNEADAEEVGWQEAFFGEGYERLLGVKRKVDPQDVLWCRLCVGSEGWREAEGRLCRVVDWEGERSEL